MAGGGGRREKEFVVLGAVEIDEEEEGLGSAKNEKRRCGVWYKQGAGAFVGAPNKHEPENPEKEKLKWLSQRKLRLQFLTTPTPPGNIKV